MAESQRICSVDGCGNKSIARRWCRKHYMRWKRSGSTDDPKPKPTKYSATCKVEGCDGDAHKPGTALGYCQAHYCRFKRHGDPHGGISSKGGSFRFLTEHLGYEGSDCISFPGQIGRGSIVLDGQRMNLGRAMAFLAFGPPPRGHIVCHSCRGGEDGCVNPNHLRWDTPKANMEDRNKDGTSNRGNRHWNNRYTEAQVRSFKMMLKSGQTLHEAADECGIRHHYAARIKSGDRWTWLEV